MPGPPRRCARASPWWPTDYAVLFLFDPGSAALPADFAGLGPTRYPVRPFGLWPCPCAPRKLPAQNAAPNSCGCLLEFERKTIPPEGTALASCGSQPAALGRLGTPAAAGNKASRAPTREPAINCNSPAHAAGAAWPSL